MWLYFLGFGVLLLGVFTYNDRAVIVGGWGLHFGKFIFAGLALLVAAVVLSWISYRVGWSGLRLGISVIRGIIQIV